MAPFEFIEPPQAEGEWVSLREIAKMGEVVTVAKGFLIDDPSNTFGGKPAPRYIIASKVKSTGDEIKTGASKGPDGGYGRNKKFEQLAEYLDANPNETVDIKFVQVSGSAYIDVTTA